MPVFTENPSKSRDSRVNPTNELPLPRLTPNYPPQDTGNEERHEVVIIGAGPAGMMLTLTLARYGLGESLMCYDVKPRSVKSGQADGLQPRTLEVLKSLDIADEILNHGCHMTEIAFWNPGQPDAKGNTTGIERSAFAPDVVVPARYKHEVTIHQGRIERVLLDNLNQYAPNCIQRNHRFIDFHIDSEGDREFPVKIEIEQEHPHGSKIRKTVRAKYLVGADGAHSQVRRSMGLQLVGESTDHIWGVVDFVVETDFPDVRKRCAIHSDHGSVMIIPRERIYSGHYLTRVYVQMTDEVPADESISSDSQSADKSRSRRAAITLESIMKQAQKVCQPYKFDIKEGTEVDWWAAYQIGQRMTPRFSLRDEAGSELVLIVGDACHTHSPKAGQGMNISMMDSYNLSWKLAHTIHGLSPKPPMASVLSTYEYERLRVARMLIEFDTKLSSEFSSKFEAAQGLEGFTQEGFTKTFTDGSAFSSGCGIEYPPGLLVQHPASVEDNPISGENFIDGVLRPGRRLLDSRVKRYADATVRHLHDAFLSTGRFRVLVFTSIDLPESDGDSSRALNTIANDILPTFPPGTVELVVLHPYSEHKFEWSDIPKCIKSLAEMRFYGPSENREHLYGTYGVNVAGGSIAVVRPDGYVGMTSSLSNSSHVDRYLSRCLVKVQ